jgi:PHD/YefM family antitoxin component YafN of YafNO toxin-antitoxin module
MLEEMKKTISMSQLAKDPERIAKDVETTGTVYRITRGRNKSMMLMDAGYFEAWKVTLEFMQRPNWREEWAEAERQVANGELYDLDDVLAELGLETPAERRRKKAARRPTAARRGKGR